jgi:LysR family transcriptional activator of nhaA
MPAHLERLNFNHLRCFWAVAREGSIAAACRALDLTQPTISKQIGDLEDALGEALFRRTGRRLVLTDLGRTVYNHADDIFALGQEIVEVAKGHRGDRPARLSVGVSDVVPKLLTRLALEPAIRGRTPAHLVCREGKTEHLLTDLALGVLDVVLTDAPLPSGSRVRAFTHRIGESAVGVFAPESLASRLRGGFPGSLAGAPMLLPTENTALRRSINAWLAGARIKPAIVAEFEDSALLKAFAEAGHGLFFAPTAVESQVTRQFGVGLVGVADGLIETLYAITAERRIRHPAVVAIVDAARGALRPA